MAKAAAEAAAKKAAEIAARPGQPVPFSGAEKAMQASAATESKASLEILVPKSPEKLKDLVTPAGSGDPDAADPKAEKAKATGVTTPVATDPAAPVATDPAAPVAANPAAPVAANPSAADPAAPVAANPSATNPSAANPSAADPSAPVSTEALAIIATSHKL